MREYRFIVDHNVGKLAKWLRLMGYDSLFFKGNDDSDMVKQALDECRIILTRDTAIIKRRVVSNGQLDAVLIESEVPEQQMRQITDILHLDCQFRPFSLCLECNQPLTERNPEEVRERVPPYVYKTQKHYMECPACKRIYWRGTHWEAMMKMLGRLAESDTETQFTQE